MHFGVGFGPRAFFVPRQATVPLFQHRPAVDHQEALNTPAEDRRRSPF